MACNAVETKIVLQTPALADWPIDKPRSATFNIGSGHSWVAWHLILLMDYENFFVWSVAWDWLTSTLNKVGWCLWLPMWVKYSVPSPLVAIWSLCLCCYWTSVGWSGLGSPGRGLAVIIEHVATLSMVELKWRIPWLLNDMLLGVNHTLYIITQHVANLHKLRWCILLAWPGQVRPLCRVFFFQWAE